MGRFKSGLLRAIIATDVAARGLDVNDLTHVIHHSLPEDFTYYTHRSGRTARAGKKGISLAFATSRDMMKIRLLEKKLNVSFSKAKIPGAVDIQLNRVLSWANSISETENKVKEGSMLVDQINQLFAETSKEELIQKLVSNELSKINYTSKDRDLNVSKESERRANKGSNEKMARLFINIGRMDKMSKRDLIDYIVSEARIRKNDIGDMSLDSKGSFFEMDIRYSKKVIKSLNGKSYKGRKIRVNSADASSRRRRS
jgi:ATP-dependent RNA helicase DeaD